MADTDRIFVGWNGNRYCPPLVKYKVGLALSGGGARGLAQVGVIKALEEADLEIGAIAGTSMGGVIGGLYASGYLADSLEKTIRGTDFSTLFSDRPPRTGLFLTQRPEKERYLISIRFDGFRPFIPKGLTAGQKLTDFISALTVEANYVSGGSFSNLKIPYRAVTTDIVSGEKVVLDRGNLADAMRSTMAFPLVYTGVESGNRILMDGGMLDPIPVDVVREMGVDVALIIAVNTSSDLLPKDGIKNPIDIANQVTSVMTMDKRQAGLKNADVVIAPEISGYLSGDFDKASELMEQGYQAGQRALPQIMEKLREKEAGDYVNLEGIKLIDVPAGFDTTLLPAPGVIWRRDLVQLANRLYEKGDLFSVEVVVKPVVSPISYAPSILLEVKCTPKPNTKNLKYTIRGNRVLDDSTIIGIISNGKEFLSSEDILNYSQSIEKLYHTKGYDLANIRHMEYLPEQRCLDIDIDEAMIEKIEVSGNHRTKNWLIRSNFPLKEGEPLSFSEVRKGVSNIYNTGLFDRVKMNLLRGKGGTIVQINVEEKKYTQVRLGWRWDDEYGSRELAELLDDNLFGIGQEYLMHTHYSKRKQKYEVSLKADRLFSTYLTYKVKGYFDILERKVYDVEGRSDSSVREERGGLELILGQQIARFGTVSGEIRWERIKNKYQPGGAIDRTRLRTFTLRSLVETIDRESFPTKGKKHLFYVEYAADVLGGQTTFTKGFSSVESYFPFGGWLNFHPKFSVGWTEGSREIPISEKFHIGGEYSFSGYKTDELSGSKMFLGNMEFRDKLLQRLYLIGRYDFGQVYMSAQQIKLRNLRHGYGFSLAYDSPLGPIDFGYGKVNRHPDRWYLNIGLVF
ncbi:MAG: patatin-like phospholipase family protein [candidate division Zixibacteria bacterium]|nr:patatin-like phospholipase family protein [candidate division Zixibacteria bacterium]